MHENNEHQPIVVVGYDGSPASRAAVDHGIRRAGPDGSLVVVHAYEVPDDFVGASYYNAMLNTVKESAAETIEELERTTSGLDGVEYRHELVLGRPAGAICKVATDRGADEIVIGTRGTGRLRGLMGSVAHDVIHLARCPVLVIPERMFDDVPAVTPAQAA